MELRKGKYKVVLPTGDHPQGDKASSVAVSDSEGRGYVYFLVSPSVAERRPLYNFIGNGALAREPRF